MVNLNFSNGVVRYEDIVLGYEYYNLERNGVVDGKIEIFNLEVIEFVVVVILNECL